MTTTVTTESGTRYEFNADMSKVRRVGGDPLRRDGEWLNFTLIGTPLVGMPLNLLLEPLGEGAVTYRRTTPVVTVEGGNPMMTHDDDIYYAPWDNRDEEETTK